MLTVQTPTAIPEADAYISTATYRLYADDHGYSYDAYQEEDIEQAIRRATKAVDAIGAGNWRGTRLTATQQTAWPRAGALDADAFEIVGVPWQVMSATAEATFRELSIPNSLAPDVTPNRMVVEEAVAGAVSRKYAVQAGDDPLLARPRLLIAEDLLAPLMVASALKAGATTVSYPARF